MTTITEGLAELKTIRARIEKERELVNNYIARAEAVRDPLEKEGGSPARIASGLQSIADLEANYINLRRKIAAANDATEITVAGYTRSITDWLIWRREIAPARRSWLQQVRNTINQLRINAQKQGNAVFAASAVVDNTKHGDIVVNISETDLDSQIVNMEEILGTLDGQLSLKNATTEI